MEDMIVPVILVGPKWDQQYGSFDPSSLIYKNI